MPTATDEIQASRDAFVDAMGRVADQSVLVFQDELELARIEMVQKLPVLGGGLAKAVVGLALGVIALLLAAFAGSFLLADYVFGNEHVWAGFALMAVVLLVAAVVLARRAAAEAKAALPPVPTQAIEQAKKLRGAIRR